jgi:multiple sugar transport system ATP-binding protein
MATLEIRNLTKIFPGVSGNVVAVKDLSLTINDQEFLVLLGPSGAGKTTTLRCVAGLERPDAGEIFFDGVPASGLSPAERDVAFVFQSYALYPRKTAFQNIAFPLEARRLPAAEIERRVREVANRLHIEHLLQRRPAQLSGGEQQRVALGRAMVRQPRLFLMDEPLTNLDFKLRVEMRTELKHLHRDLKATFFYVTNDQVEAMTMADRVAILNRGELQQVGPPEEVYDHPINLFVAGFVGSPRMNFLPCALIAEGGHRLRSLDGAWEIPIAARLAEATAPGQELTLGVRPEDIALFRDRRPGALRGAVYVSEPLGDRTIVDVKLGEAIVKVKAPPTFVAEPGQPLWLEFAVDRLHLFDRSGARVEMGGKR